MKVKQIPTGLFIEGKEVIAIELHPKSDCFVRILTYGAIIQNFVVINAHGEKQDVVLGFDQVDDYVNPAYLANYPYMGAIIGRYANRIKNAQFTLNKLNYKLSSNMGSNQIHGGKLGFDKRHWEIDQISGNETPSVTLSYLSKDGEEGYPGNLKVSLQFSFSLDMALSLVFTAITDKSTPINLTHHGYFNLNPKGGSIAHHQQYINASYMLEQDQEWCVTGKLLPLDEFSHYDFRKIKSIGQDWNPDLGYDQTYLLDKAYSTFGLASKTFCQASGLSLNVYTTEPVAHFYTGKYLSVKFGKNQQNYNSFDAFCIETQHHPNALNIPDFPSTILHPGEVYSQKTVYQIVELD